MKGQRPISSFFCKKPEGRQQPHQRHVSADADDTEPPVKRRKRDEFSHKPAGDRHRANGASPVLMEAQISHAGDASEGEPIDLTGGPHQPSGQPSLSMRRRAEEPVRSSRAHPISCDKEARHSRFQNKLVLGPASGLERDKTVVPQKTTPLEDQVYALKRKHPGILLLVEVCPVLSILLLLSHGAAWAAWACTSLASRMNNHTSRWKFCARRFARARALIDVSLHAGGVQIQALWGRC